MTQAKRLRDPNDPLKLIIVRDMWLIGFDAPCLHTMYVDNRRYQNRAITSAEVIQELINLAKEMSEASRRGVDLGLTDDELAFYDALEVNDSAVQVLGDETLKTIAQELVKAIRRNVTIDWTEREAVRAKLRVMVKRLLKKYGYPPDKQEKATQTVLQQAETLCKDWVS